MSATYPDLPFTTFPDSVQEFDTMLDMTESDGELVKHFQEAMQNGDYALAQSYFLQIPNANKKFIDSTKINTLLQTCVAIQRYYLGTL